MDPLTHTLLTHKFVSRRPAIALLVANGPDLVFYLTYPAWVLAQGRGLDAIRAGDWPDPPSWIETAHHCLHSIPVVVATAGAVRLVTGRWPAEAAKAWLGHILVDIPTHARARWGPRFLWPLSDYAADGWSWAEAALRRAGCWAKGD